MTECNDCFSLSCLQTIIECLKQACTGELPPNTRSGQSFIHDPKVCKQACSTCCLVGLGTWSLSLLQRPQVAGESETKAQIKLRFVTADGQPMVIIRSFLVEGLHDLIPPARAPLLWWLTLLLWLQLTQKKLQLQYKTLDQILQTHNKATGQKEAISYRCADMDRVVPNLMGVSKVMTALLPFRSACNNLSSRRP